MVINVGTSAPDRIRRFEALYERFAPDVLVYARRRTSAEAADDIVADVFLVAWRRFSDLPDEPRPWLLGVARRTLANHSRGARRRRALFDKLVREPAPFSRNDSTENNRIFEALATLRELDREALMLIGWEGLQPHEAAEVIGCSPRAFRVRLHRARQRLALALVEHSAASEPPHPTPASTSSPEPSLTPGSNTATPKNHLRFEESSS